MKINSIEVNTKIGIGDNYAHHKIPLTIYETIISENPLKCGYDEIYFEVENVTVKFEFFTCLLKDILHYYSIDQYLDNKPKYMYNYTAKEMTYTEIDE